MVQKKRSRWLVWTMLVVNVVYIILMILTKQGNRYDLPWGSHSFWDALALHLLVAAVLVAVLLVARDRRK